MYELKRLGVMSVAKVCAVVGIIVGLIAGIIAAIGSLFTKALIAGATDVAGASALPFMGAIGVLAIVVFPIMYAIAGFIGGAIGAVVYNLVAGKVGGYELDLQPISAAPPVQQKTPGRPAPAQQPATPQQPK